MIFNIAAMYWYLQEIVVLPEYQGMGIGTKIVNYLVDYAVKNFSTGNLPLLVVFLPKGRKAFIRSLDLK